MKRFSTSILAGGLLLVASSAFAALGPVTNANTAGTVANANTVTVTIPGLVGVDLESNLAWDFSILTPAPAAATCAASGNQWPIGIVCANGGASTVLYDPTNNTDPSIGTSPNNSTVATGAALAALGTYGEKAIWLAFFCSKTGVTQPTYSATLAAFVPATTPGTTGFDETNLSVKASSTQNTPVVGGAARQAFGAGGSTVALPGGTLGAGGATFGWTRADQVVTMTLPNNAALSQGVYASTLFFTIAK